MVKKKQKKKSIITWVIVIVVLVIGVILSFQIEKCNEERKIKKEEERTEAIKREEVEKIKKERENFLNSIEQHYKETNELFNANKFQDALDKIDLFERYSQLHYKDLEEIKMISKIELLKNKLKELPTSELEENLEAYKELSLLDPSNSEYKEKINYYQKKWDQVLSERRERELRESCDLELISSRWSHEYGYATYEGQVKNISDSRLKNVQAVVTWSDKNHNFITSDSALIDYNPIMPGQTSPFKVMATFNPAMHYARVEFSFLMGGKIKTYRKKK